MVKKLKAAEVLEGDIFVVTAEDDIFCAGDMTLASFNKPKAIFVGDELTVTRSPYREMGIQLVDWESNTGVKDRSYWITFKTNTALLKGIE